MEFHECFTLLSSRPAHAHEHCTENQQVQEHPQDVNVYETNDKSSFKQKKDWKLQNSQELVQTFTRLQEMRVQIFKDFRQFVVQIVMKIRNIYSSIELTLTLCGRGFQVHKKTQQFPAFCSGIKDRFSAVSEQINHIEKLLRDEKQQVAIAQLLRKIQEEEKEKLLLTSAVLIEKMRLCDAAKHHEPDHSTIAFLERSVETLTMKHTDCVVRINEILEELRAESADLEDA
ncbi:hypothetical protein KXD40_001495 [Peronospora effusa]|uniref:Uncharacterized protein n=1 Tax=Peronospora effusa TaxID=542832 RepID=A0A425C9W9_9STRA|nr:hypothetical protein DD237_002022 [Peronospora effusa]UIZ26217.1 hypothetical protein KXD40_001495 [Peronospora effusa]